MSARIFREVLIGLTAVATVLMVGDAAAVIGRNLLFQDWECGRIYGMAFMCAVLVCELGVAHFVLKLMVLKGKYDQLVSAGIRDPGCRESLLLAFLRLANPLCVAICLWAAFIRCSIHSGPRHWLWDLIFLAIVVIVSQCRTVVLIRGGKTPRLSFVMHVISYAFFIMTYAVVRLSSS